MTASVLEGLDLRFLDEIPESVVTDTPVELEPDLRDEVQAALEGDDPVPPKAEYTCEVCGTALTYSGRGRHPKRCAEHKSRTAGARKATSRTSSTAKARADLAGNLAKSFGMLGVGLSNFMPVTGVTMFKRSENVANALVKIAEAHPAMMATLEASAVAMEYVNLVEAGGAIGVAVMVDLQKVKPDAAFAQMLGVTETYNEVYAGIDDSQVATSYTDVPTVNAFEVQVPPRFEKVT